tara:strand:- start:272 stop:574 length:303 start_codon:yes stop_codon:yes gene_type:complete
MTKTGDEDKEAVPTWLSQAADRIIGHMNSDHSNSIVSTLHAQFGIKDPGARMERLKVDGYYISSNENLYFAKFTKKCRSVDEYREELIKHAQIYRKFEIP